MFRKTISLITLAALMINLMGMAGCAKMRKATLTERRVNQLLHTRQVTVYTAEDTVEFSPNTARISDKDKAIVGIDREQRDVALPWNEIDKVEWRDTSGKEKVIIIAVAATVVALVVWLALTLDFNKDNTCSLEGIEL